MCGIVSVLGQNVSQYIKLGLKQLQNRGYDSIGFSIINKKQFYTKKYTNAYNDPIKLLNNEIIPETYNGIGHTRWATHGSITIENTHPHKSYDNKIMLVHNGIIENYEELKNMLIQKNITFYSDTDTEVIPNLISYYYRDNTIHDSILLTTNDLHGTWALCIQCIDYPDTIYCIKNKNPLLIGYNNESCIITSELNGFLNHIPHYINIIDSDLITIKYNSSITIISNYNYPLINNTFQESSLNGEKHWTIKEIKDQKNIINQILNENIIINDSIVEIVPLTKYYEILKNIDHIILLSCGSSYFSSQIGRNFLKKNKNINTIQVFDGADFSIHDIPKKGQTIFIFVSQSGETMDLIKCVNIINNYFKIGIINNKTSTLSKLMNANIFCNIGRENAVASTKSFTSQVIILSLLSIYLDHLLNNKTNINIINDLHLLKEQLNYTINNYQYESLNINQNCFILGRDNDEYIAKETALKMKEINYIHAEGYSSSVLKHGPLALITENFTVILINSDPSHFKKNKNIYNEIISRNGNVITITSQPNIPNSIYVETNNSYQCIINIINIQMLIYNLSLKLNINPDKPRNLAKVVTVE
jgi:glutamine---fructose-6-phosphate transaminase (isomerizing)